MPAHLRSATIPIASVLCCLVWLLPACSAPKPGPELLAPTEAQTQMRSYQSRTFDVAEPKQALRAVMAVLQDLGFLIERANEALGLVTGAKFAEPGYLDVVGVTVTVRQQGEGKMLVRINAIFNNRPIEDPAVYQNFFAALERALFLDRG